MALLLAKDVASAAKAVTIGQKDKYNGAKMEEFQRDHAVYMAFAPAENPQIALAVIVENAGWGAGVAAPIARRVFDYALLGQYPSEEDMLAVQKGLAAAPIGKPRLAADMVGTLVPGAGTEASVRSLSRVTVAAAAFPVMAAEAPASAAIVAAARPRKGAGAVRKTGVTEDKARLPVIPVAARMIKPD